LTVDAPEPLADPDELESGSGAAEQADADQIAAQQAGEIFFHLLKGLKNIGIYRHNHGRYGEYLEPAFVALTDFLKEWHNLPLKLGPYTLEYNKQVIYEEHSKENLSYRFYRDGMRFLIFREGIELEELLRFVLLTIEGQEDNSNQHEDMITRLWKESFQFIEYVVVEGFAFGELSQDQVEIEVEKIVGYLRNQLAANSDDITRFARLNLEDLELELNDVEQVRGNIISGRPASSDDKQWVQDELYNEEKNRLFAKMVLILFQILERDCASQDFEMISESFSQVLDTLILSEDVRGSVAVLQRLDQMQGKEGLDSVQKEFVAKIRLNFSQRMAEPQRLQAVVQYMTLAQVPDEQAVKAYMQVISPTELPVLTEMLEQLERIEAREILIDVLAEHGKHHTSIFAERLDNKASNVVKDMLAIIDKINPSDKLSLYANCLDHPNIMIRLEGLKVLAQSRSEAAIRHLEHAAKDEDIQMRLAAYRALAQRHPKRSTPMLKTRMRSDNFASLDRREQLAIAMALGETRTPDALKFFASLFGRKGNLFSRAKNNDVKLMAVKGLLAMKNLDAFKVLSAEIQNRGHSKEVLEELHRAAIRLKSELTGQPTGPNQTNGPAN
jgi:hypothetical protein